MNQESKISILVKRNYIKFWWCLFFHRKQWKNTPRIDYEVTDILGKDAIVNFHNCPKCNDIVAEVVIL